MIGIITHTLYYTVYVYIPVQIFTIRCKYKADVGILVHKWNTYTLGTGTNTRLRSKRHAIHVKNNLNVASLMQTIE